MVIAAAALTTLVTAAVGAALAVFAGPVGNGQAAATGDDPRAMIGRALGGVPFTFWAASWSDPLGLLR